MQHILWGLLLGCKSGSHINVLLLRYPLCLSFPPDALFAARPRHTQRKPCSISTSFQGCLMPLVWYVLAVVLTVCCTRLLSSRRSHLKFFYLEMPYRSPLIASPRQTWSGRSSNFFAKPDQPIGPGTFPLSRGETHEKCNGEQRPPVPVESLWWFYKEAPDDISLVE